VHKLLQENVAVKALLLPDETVPLIWEDKIEITRGSISDPAAVAQAAGRAKRLCVPIFRTVASRWFVTTAITATSPRVKGNKKARTM
jgi:hypothetical protein